MVSAKMGDEDLLAKPELTIGVTPPPPIEIVLRDDGGNIQGSLAAEARGDGDGQVMIVLVPESEGASPAVWPDGGDFFRFNGVAPGAHRVHALKQEVEYATPEAMRALASRGERVQVTAGSEAKVELKTLTEMPQ